MDREALAAVSLEMLRAVHQSSRMLLAEMQKDAPGMRARIVAARVSALVMLCASASALVLALNWSNSFLLALNCLTLGVAPVFFWYHVTRFELPWMSFRKTFRGVRGMVEEQRQALREIEEVNNAQR